MSSTGIRVRRGFWRSFVLVTVMFSVIARAQPPEGSRTVRDGDRPAKSGPRDGDASAKRGPRDGEVSYTAPERISRSTGEKAFSTVLETPARTDVRQALRLAVEFFHSRVAIHGGYVWEYSGDLSIQVGEGKTRPTTIWVQPPGTPTVGEAFLDAWEAAGDSFYCDTALDAAHALLKGQLGTGGWDYFVEFDPDQKQPTRTNLDDDTTQAALRFLMRLDKALRFESRDIHASVVRGLDSLLKVQYPNGAWFVFVKSLKPPDAASYPVLRASYPESWPRSPGGYAERPVIAYITNDDLMTNMIRTMLDAWETYGEERYLAAAKKGGDFLLLAQMPEPQPAWIQQYDANMQPVWGRKFEPPAITGHESQNILEGLMLLYRKTGNSKYLEPIPRALAYLRRSLLPDGRVARFYELRINRPLYFTKDYELTYSGDDVPTHYGFVFDSRLDSIEAQYKRLLAAGPSTLNADPPRPRSTPELLAAVRRVLADMDERGAWVERGPMRFIDCEPPAGVIRSRTFADNVRTLCDYLTTDE